MIALALVVCSGGGLLLRYRPGGDATTTWLTWLHLGGLFIAVQGVVAGSVIGIMRSPRPSEVARRILALATAGVAVAVAAFTGLLLRWDQLALWAVTTGQEIRGYTWTFGDEVRFALVNDSVVGVDTVRRLLVVHLGSAVVLTAAGVALPWWLGRRRPLATTPQEPTENPGNADGVDGRYTQA